MKIFANFWLSDEEKEKLKKAEDIQKELENIGIEGVLIEKGVNKNEHIISLWKDFPEVGEEVIVSGIDELDGLNLKVVEKLERNSYRLRKADGGLIENRNGIGISDVFVDRRNIVCL